MIDKIFTEIETVIKDSKEDDFELFWLKHDHLFFERGITKEMVKEVWDAKY